MEANNNKYTKGKIYQIIDNSNNKCYYGSTIERLSARMAGHRRKYKEYKDGKYPHVTVFQIFDEFGVENCKIELVENYSTNSKEELLRKEGEHISKGQCVNRCIAGRTRQEWRDEHREEKQKYDQQYNNENKTMIHAKGNQKHTCEVCSGKYTSTNRAHHKRTITHTAAMNSQQNSSASSSDTSV